MKICIVGAGSIGGLLAARLARAGCDTSVIARGPQLAAIRAHGLRLIEHDGSEFSAPVRAFAHAQEAGPQDYVILAVKAHQLAAATGGLQELCHDTTTLVMAQNGIPWWYFAKTGGANDGRVLQSVDPGGAIAAALPVERIVGSVVYPAAQIVAPGVIRHVENNRYTVGEIDNTQTPRVAALAEALKNAGFKASVSSDIRTELWIKLWGNLSFNPISALTHGTIADICAFPPSRDLTIQLMREAQSVAEAFGIRFRISLEKRIAGAEAVGAHKTSMLQDIEAGRAVEIDALVGAVVELAGIGGVPVPHLETVYALVRALGHTMALHKARLRMDPLRDSP